MKRSASPEPVSAFVLAGGRSSRMGHDKALLELAGRPLVSLALERLRPFDPNPRICGSRPDLARFAPVVPDNFPGCGPLAGIQAALAASDTELNLFLAVDLPLLPAEFLRWMLHRSQTSGAAATIPLFAGRTQPLCAVYRRSLEPGLVDSLRRGHYKVMTGIATAAARVDVFHVESVASALPAGEWPAEPWLREWFRNLNSPDDYKLLQTAAAPGAFRRHPIS